LNFLERFSKKSSNTKIHENPSGVNRVVPCGRADRQTGSHTQTNNTGQEISNIFCICDEYVINLFVCTYEVRKGT